MADAGAQDRPLGGGQTGPTCGAEGRDADSLAYLARQSPTRVATSLPSCSSSTLGALGYRSEKVN